jgi:hypothetical protein
MNIMQISRPISPTTSRHPVAKPPLFAAVAAGGILRRPVRDIEKGPGRDALLAEVKRHGFHLIECGDQFIIICNKGRLRVHA